MKSFSLNQFPLPPHKRQPLVSSLLTFVCDLCHRKVHRATQYECQECGVCGCFDCWEKDDKEFQSHLSQPLLIVLHNHYCPECFIKKCRERIEEDEQKFEEARHEEKTRADEESRREQELLQGGERVVEEQKWYERDCNQANEEGTLIRCDYCKNEKPENYFDRCDHCGNQCCKACIIDSENMSYRTLEFYSANVSGKFCPFCFRLKKEELEEAKRQRNRAQTENEEENT